VKSTPLRARIDELKERIEQHTKPAPRERFSETRWPYTYAADFVRAHESVIPDHVWERVGSDVAIYSRAAASRARVLWARELGISDVVVAEHLAAAYLREHFGQLEPGMKLYLPAWVQGMWSKKS
jgi:hypothetical protein